ncbi:MAG: flagellar biosynthetic protein FliR [Vampirovibrionales bacterium]
MAFEPALQAYGTLYTTYQPWVDTGLLLLSRVLAFMHTAPVFGRKDIPGQMKTALGVMVCVCMLQAHPELIRQYTALTEVSPTFMVLQIFANATVGLILGMMANLAVQTIGATGNLITNQAGLNMAAMFDPSTRSQSMILEPVFLAIATWLFISIGGMHQLIEALSASIQHIPVFMLQNTLLETLNMDLVVESINSILPVALAMSAPTLVVTLALDVMLGILNRTAQQIPVFQISNTIKPVLALGILMMSLPTMMEQMEHILQEFFRLQP